MASGGTSPIFLVKAVSAQHAGLTWAISFRLTAFFYQENIIIDFEIRQAIHKLHWFTYLFLSQVAYLTSTQYSLLQSSAKQSAPLKQVMTFKIQFDDY